MERKNPSREGSRRLSAKPSKGSEMKKAARQLGLAAAESDKDSGFSDGSSECLSSAEQMESEDMLSALGWSREDKPRPSSKPASGAFPTLSPMVVMKNVLVKQLRKAENSPQLLVRRRAQQSRRLQDKDPLGRLDQETGGLGAD